MKVIKTPVVKNTTPDQLIVRRENGKIWSHIRRKYLEETPEEMVRQEYLCTLINEYGFQIDQMDEEREITGRGSGHARADFVIWRSVQEKRDGKNPLIIVECKSDNITIKPADYKQGDNYARLTGARFFATHNNRETKHWRVRHDEMPKSLEEISNIPHANASDKEIEELIAKLKVFKEDEFADLLHQCHNVIRNREKLDPAAAFDEIAKILFVKVYVERELRAKRQRENLFTADFLDRQIGKHPLNTLFEQTREAYADDNIFENDEEIRLRPATGREIVKLLERYNLSDTSEDIKGIAFERFLGRTFRGEIGQFFTPRTIVEFMIRMMEPKEGEIICDPASGSGGFLIRFFEIVRQQILANADAEYRAFKAELEKRGVPDTRKAEALREKFGEIQSALDQQTPGSRLWKLANRCIYGTDANERMARTSKMNMIMHGDGHGGVHHHDGFINVNGIFEGRFDSILTNPPFGAYVETSDIVYEAEISPEKLKQYKEEHGRLYTEAIGRVRAAVGKPIASLFELPKGERIKTQILFIERCLDLLNGKNPNATVGMVLPDDILSNKSFQFARDYLLSRGFLKAIVSVPYEAFKASGSNTKCSLVFFGKKPEQTFDVSSLPVLIATCNSVGLDSSGRAIDSNDLPAILAAKKNKKVPFGILSKRPGILIAKHAVLDPKRLLPEYYLAEEYKNESGRIALKELCTLRNKVIEPKSNPDKEYKLLSVHFDGTVSLRETKLGKEFKYKQQFEAHAGDLAFARIDAINGAIGLVPKELHGSVCSQEYYILNPKIDSYLLWKLLREEGALAQIRGLVSGMTGRRRIKPDDVMDLRVIKISSSNMKKAENAHATARDAYHRWKDSEVRLQRLIEGFIGE